MSDSTVQIPPASTGQLVATRQITVSSNSVQLQCIVVGDPTTADNYGAVVAKGTQGAFAQAVQELKDAGRNPVTLMGTATATTTTAGTIFPSATRWLGSVSSSGSSFAVTTGKTFRVQSIMVAISSSTSTSNNVLGQLLWSTTTLAATSPGGPAARAGTPSSTTGSLGSSIVPIPDGFELAASVNYGLAQTSSATTGTVTIQVVGYEY